jgi:hypothetical protein
MRDAVRLRHGFIQATTLDVYANRAAGPPPTHFQTDLVHLPCQQQEFHRRARILCGQAVACHCRSRIRSTTWARLARERGGAAGRVELLQQQAHSRCDVAWRGLVGRVLLSVVVFREHMMTV